MTLEEVREREGELFMAVARGTSEWASIQGVVGVGLGLESSDHGHRARYVIRVMLSEEPARLRQVLPDRVRLKLSGGDSVELPVELEFTGRPKT
jgi:hypothetical protein